MNMTTMTPVLRAEGLVKSYAGAHALRGVGIEVHPGRALAIMGPSGSGKTTLLHCLAGLVQPDAGTVVFSPQGGPPMRVDGLSTKDSARLRRESFGFVFQQGLLMPELTAVENIAVAGMLSGMSRPQALEAGTGWLHSLGLGEHAHKRIGQLSGGQAQRVAIARSQIASPEVTFADEPTGALDSRTSQEVMSLLMASTVGAGRALVIVTHDAEVAARAQERVRMNDGLVETASGAATPDGAEHGIVVPPRPESRPPAPRVDLAVADAGQHPGSPFAAPAPAPYGPGRPGASAPQRGGDRS